MVDEKQDVDEEPKERKYISSNSTIYEEAIERLRKEKLEKEKEERRRKIKIIK